MANVDLVQLTEQTKKLSAMVVEDEKVANELLSSTFKNFFSSVDSYYDGEAALKFYVEKKPDIVFVDIVMPGMNGIELSRKIRELNPSQIIVVISASNDIEKISESIEVGVNSFIQKPIDTKKIIEDYDKKIEVEEKQITRLEKELEELNKKEKDKPSKTNKSKIESIKEKVENTNKKIKQFETDLETINQIFETYFENDTIKDEYFDRLDKTLLEHFRSGLLKQYKSNDVLLRKTEVIKILDAIRKEVIWE